MEDKEHLQWICNRIIQVYGEPKNIDFMLRFQKIIDSMPEVKEYVRFDNCRFLLVDSLTTIGLHDGDYVQLRRNGVKYVLMGQEFHTFSGWKDHREAWCDVRIRDNWAKYMKPALVVVVAGEVDHRAEFLEWAEGKEVRVLTWVSGLHAVDFRANTRNQSRVSYNLVNEEKRTALPSGGWTIRPTWREEWEEYIEKSKAEIWLEKWKGKKICFVNMFSDYFIPDRIEEKRAWGRSAGAKPESFYWWEPHDWIEYKEPVQVELGPEDIQPGDIVRDQGTAPTWRMITSTGMFDVAYANHKDESYDHMFHHNYEIKSLGGDWRPCSKVEN